MKPCVANASFKKFRPIYSTGSAFGNGAFVYVCVNPFTFSSMGGKKKKKTMPVFCGPEELEVSRSKHILKGAYAEWGRAPVSVINTPWICAGFSKAVFFRSRTEKTSLHAHNSLPLNYQH